MTKRHLPVLPEGFRDEALPQGTFSHSQYAAYKRCPTQYEFRYVQGLKSPPGVALVKGTAVHAGTELIHRSLIADKKLPLPGLVLEAVGSSFDDEAKAVESWDDTRADLVRDEAQRLALLYLNQAGPHLRPTHAEEGFAKRVGIVPMVGFIDLRELSDEGALVIADTKSSSAKWSAHDVATDVQLTLYALVAGAHHVRIDNLVTLKSGPVYHRLPSTREPQAKRVYVEDLEETVDLVRRGIFPKTSIDNWACSEKWCGHWRRCRGRNT